MKKIFLAAFAAAVALPSLAQGGYPFNPTYAEDHNIYYGLRLGWALATVNSDDDVLDGGSARSGLNIGAVIGFQLAPADEFVDIGRGTAQQFRRPADRDALLPVEAGDAAFHEVSP